ncbi:MAG: hypothetical protein Q8K60_08450 [Parachlamydiaceae bacterium]|nr:hypothetical protein [Parachlamydiaceae bacterium]
MSHPKQQHGNHTWDCILFYHRCPKCGYINENNDKFDKMYNQLEKTVLCLRCHHRFTIIKKQNSSFGPLLGHDSQIID